MDFSRENVEQHAGIDKEMNAYFETLINNFEVEIDKCVMVDQQIKAENERLTTKILQYKGIEKFYKNKEKNSEQTIKSINTTISNLKNQISKQEATYSDIEKERYKLKIKISKCEDELLENLIESEHKIKELDNIILKTGQVVGDALALVSGGRVGFYALRCSLFIFLYGCGSYLESRVELTTRSKQPWSKDNTKNDRVSSTSKSSCSKNKVSEHRRIFQYFTNKKHTSCNDNVKDAKMNVCNDTTCATCEKCMVDNLYDVCVSKFLNDMNSCAKPQITNVSNNKNQKEQKAKIMTSKKLDMKSKSLATPSVNTPIIYRRWKETGRILDFVKISKLVPNTNVEKADQMILVYEKASTSNPLELRSIWFSNPSIFLLAGYQNMFMVGRLGLFKTHDRKSEDSH
ncbi:hypothetical protein Tco_0513631 [Tanacetum coccineum]